MMQHYELNDPLQGTNRNSASRSVRTKPQPDPQRVMRIKHFARTSCMQCVSIRGRQVKLSLN